MNKLATIAVLAGALAAPAVYAGLQISVATLPNTPYKYGSGGEFKVRPNDLLSQIVSPSAYSATTLQGYDTGSAIGTFPAFCLEAGEPIFLGNTYNVAISQAAKLGGGGSVGGEDPISKGTAFLITQFAAGTLTDYDFDDDGENYGNGLTGRIGAAGLLQEAIWYLEDELTDTGLQLLGNNSNPFVTLAVTQFNNLTGAKADDNNSTFARVMNLTNDSGELRQDLLVVVVPEPGTYIAGALLGLPFLAGAVRRIRRNRAA